MQGFDLWSDLFSSDIASLQLAATPSGNTVHFHLSLVKDSEI